MSVCVPGKLDLVVREWFGECSGRGCKDDRLTVLYFVSRCQYDSRATLRVPIGRICDSDPDDTSLS